MSDLRPYEDPCGWDDGEGCVWVEYEDDHDFYCVNCLRPRDWSKQEYHKPTEFCSMCECPKCSERDCPHGDPKHYREDADDGNPWDSGCPSCGPWPVPGVTVPEPAAGVAAGW